MVQDNLKRTEFDRHRFKVNLYGTGRHISLRYRGRMEKYKRYEIMQYRIPNNLMSKINGAR